MVSYIFLVESFLAVVYSIENNRYFDQVMDIVSHCDYYKIIMHIMQPAYYAKVIAVVRFKT